MTTDVIDYLSQIDQLFHSYLATWPQEASRLAVLGQQLAGHDEKLNDRKNMIGHLTASALLIYHRFLKRWLQPGGHLEAGEMPEAGALRELKEETGLTTKFSSGCNPVDIDSHTIPASSSKQEGEHLHHDFQYIYTVLDEGDIELQQAEVSDYKWVSLDELGSGDYGQRLARVAAKIMKDRSEKTGLL